MYLASKYSVMY